MAQAARLNLRMQKELKLLLTDPPPGASFPCLSSDSDLSSFSLTTIDAQIEGLEGTVYAKGVFNIKIQIPERYPFQPPSVTFATPIYHPNIDNGGRICLDILNLPPKGAWQPSMNISTVVTSIGLLLSEPNPDDGLMCEVSREYKYNRQAFDQKARAMTEKYAQPGASGNICGGQGVGSVSKPDMMDFEIKENESRPEAYQNMASNNETCGLSRKLSLESMGQTRKRDDIEEVTETSKSKLFLNDAKEPVKVEGTKREFKDTLQNSTWSQEKVGGSRRKLSLEVLSHSQRRNDNEKENVVPNHCTSNASFSLSVADSGSVPRQVLNSQRQELHQFQDSKLVDVNIRMKSEKQCGLGQKQSFGLREVIDGRKEKVIATPQFLPLETGSKATDKTLPEAPARNFVKLQPQKDSMSRIENSTLTTSHKKLHLVGKKLVLGSRVSETQEKDYEENLDTVSSSVVSYASSTVPSMDKDYDKLSVLTKKHDKDGTGWIQSLGSPFWMEDTNENDTQLPLGSHSLFTNPLKHLPQQKDSGRDQKWQFDDDDNCKAAGGMRQQDEEKSSKAEAMVVVDSEDSEEEKSGSSKTKPLVRKRLGRWRLRV